jgi:hypothetical protein
MNNPPCRLCMASKMSLLINMSENYCSAPRMWEGWTTVVLLNPFALARGTKLITILLYILKCRGWFHLAAGRIHVRHAIRDARHCPRFPAVCDPWALKTEYSCSHRTEREEREGKSSILIFRDPGQMNNAPVLIENCSLATHQPPTLLEKGSLWL